MAQLNGTIVIVIVFRIGILVGTTLVQTHPAVYFHQLPLPRWLLQTINILCHLFDTLRILVHELLECIVTGIGLVPRFTHKVGNPEFVVKFGGIFTKIGPGRPGP